MNKTLHRLLLLAGLTLALALSLRASVVRARRIADLQPPLKDMKGVMQSRIPEGAAEAKAFSAALEAAHPLEAATLVKDFLARHAIPLDSSPSKVAQNRSSPLLLDAAGEPLSGIDAELAGRLALLEEDAGSAAVQLPMVAQFMEPPTYREIIDMYEAGIDIVEPLDARSYVCLANGPQTRSLASNPNFRAATGHKKKVAAFPADPAEAAPSVVIIPYRAYPDEQLADLEALGIHTGTFSAAARLYYAELTQSQYEAVADLVWVAWLAPEGDRYPEGAPILEPDDSRELVNAPNVWAVGETGEGVRVGVVDSGIWAGHHDFPEGTILNPTPVPDEDGHGTHVSGIIASRGSHSADAKGVAPGALLWPEYLDPDNLGTIFDRLVDNNVTVVNNSWGVTDPIPPFPWHHDYSDQAEVVDQYVEDGLTVIQSAGNEGQDGAGTITEPGTAKNVITVGAISYTVEGESGGVGHVAWYSSRGPTLFDGRLKPEVVAPGGDSLAGATCPGYHDGVVSTNAQNGVGEWMDDPECRWSSPGYDDEYTALKGTSMAAPHVTGIAALFQHYYLDNDFLDGLRPRDFKAHLIANAMPLKGYGTQQDNGYANNDVGYGLVDAYHSLFDEPGKQTLLWAHGTLIQDLSESDDWEITLPSGTEELIVVLAYEDRPGWPGDDPQLPELEEDFNVEVTSPIGGFYSFDMPIGVTSGSPEEKLVITNPDPLPTSGPWQITVYAESWSYLFGATRDYTVVAIARSKHPSLSIAMADQTVDRGQSFSISPTMTNLGGLTAAGVTAEITAPEGFGGEVGLEKFVGNLVGVGAEQTEQFTLTAPLTCGSYTLTASATGINREFNSPEHSAQATFTVTVPCSGLQVLLVDDDDNSPDVRPYYEEALTALGATYDVWDTTYPNTEPGAGDLAGYEAVVWFSGDKTDGYAGPAAAAEAGLASYLGDGGCFFISSQDYYDDRGLTSFMQTHLGVASISSGGGQTEVTGSGSVFGGFGPYTFSYPFYDASDRVTPDDLAELAFAGSEYDAAIDKSTETYDTAYLGFPFEALPTATAREEVLGAFLGRCSGGRILLVDDDDNSPDMGPYYKTGLNYLRAPYDVWDTANSTNEPGLADLAAYRAVLWFTGDASGTNAGPSETSEASLASYLDGGGCFLISSENYHSRGTTAFMQDYLGVGSATNNVGQSVVTGTGSVFGGLRPYTLNHLFADSSDALSPDASAELAFGGTAHHAGINKNTASYHTAYLGFALEAVSIAGREEVIEAFVPQCGIPAAAEYIRVPNYRNSVEAFEWPMGAQVTLEVDDPGNGTGVDYIFGPMTVAELAPSGTQETLVQFPVWQSQIELRPGFKLYVSDGVTTKVHVITGFEITGYNLDLDTVWGVARPNANVKASVRLASGWAVRNVMAGPTGAWNADFHNPGGPTPDEQHTADIVPGTPLGGDERDEDGDRTAFNIDASTITPTIEGNVVDWNGQVIQGLSLRVRALSADWTQVYAEACSGPGTQFTLTGIPTSTDILVFAQGDATACGNDTSFYGFDFYKMWGDPDRPNDFSYVHVWPGSTVSAVDLYLGPAVPAVEYLVFNLDNPVLDHDLRQAIAYGTDREELLWEGYLPNGYFGTVIDSYVPDSHWAAAPDSALHLYPYNPALARSMLNAQGWIVNQATGIREKGGVPLSLSYKTSTHAYRMGPAELFVDQMLDIGIEVIPEYMAWSEFIGPSGPFATRDFDLAEVSSTQCGHTNDETCVPFAMFTTGGPENQANYSSAAADSEYEQAQAATSHEDRLTHAINHQVIVMEDLPKLPLYTRTAPRTISGNAGSAGVTLGYTNGSPQSVTSGAGGTYAITVPTGWSGTVTPSKPGYTFSPPNRPYALVVSDQTDQDYAAAPPEPEVVAILPAENSTVCRTPQIGAQLLLTELLLDLNGSFDPSIVSLELDDVDRTGAAKITQSSTFPVSEATILYTPPSNLSAGNHHVDFSYPSPTGTQTRTWNFTASGTTCTTIAAQQAPATTAMGAPTAQQPVAVLPRTITPGAGLQNPYRRLIQPR